jgi:enoyl-CoA hydratase/carnithine racemase
VLLLGHRESLSDRPRSDPRIGGTVRAMADPVTIDKDGDVAVITIDDGKANALSFSVLEGLDRALDQAESAKAVALIGREGKFTAGFDLAVMTGDADGARRMLGTGAQLGLRIYMFPIPVVLGVTGHALAMGGILTTTADYRVGAEGNYKIGLNEVAIGMPVPTFGVELCRDRLSPAWFTRCVQQAELCSPTNAVAAGFLDEVVALDAVPARSVEVATRLAATVHPGPFRMTRETIRADLAETLAAGLDADMNRFDVST